MRPKKQFSTKIPCIGLLDYRLDTTEFDYYCWSGLLLLEWTTTGLFPDRTGLGYGPSCPTGYYYTTGLKYYCWAGLLASHFAKHLDFTVIFRKRVKNHRKSRSVPQSALYTGCTIMQKVNKVTSTEGRISENSTKICKQMRKNTMLVCYNNKCEKTPYSSYAARFPLKNDFLGRKNWKNPENREFFGKSQKLLQDRTLQFIFPFCAFLALLSGVIELTIPPLLSTFAETEGGDS